MGRADWALLRVYLCLALVFGAAPIVPAAVVGTVKTVAAGGLGDGDAAKLATLRAAKSLAVDVNGNIFIVDENRIRKVSPAGIISTIAGTGTAGFSGDGGPAVQAAIHVAPASAGTALPRVAVDAAGNVYFSDIGNHRVRRIDPAGVITTVAGNGEAASTGDGGLATAAGVRAPTGIAVDGSGSLFVATEYRIRKVAGGIITTVAGTGVQGFDGDGGPATAAKLDPREVVPDGAGGYYFIDVGDRNGERIRRVTASGIISTVAGRTRPPPPNPSNGDDGIPAAEADLLFLTGLARDGAGNLFFALGIDNQVRFVDSSGILRSVTRRFFGFSPDGTPAVDAYLANPVDIAVDAAGNIYIAESLSRRVRQVDTGGILRTAAGGTGDGAQAANAALRSPADAVVDAAGNVYIADMGTDRIKQVSAAGVVTVLAGTDYAGSGFPSTTASDPTAVAVGPEGALYFAVSGGIGKIDSLGRFFMVTVADSPSGLAFDTALNLYVAEAGRHRVLKLTASGTISNFAGSGTPAFGGDGGPAVSAGLSVHGVALDRNGNLYLADPLNHRVRRVDSAGIISTVAGTGAAGSAGDGGAATAAQLNQPLDVAVDDAGYLFIADSGNHRVRVVDPGGVIRTLAGTGAAGYSGDEGPAEQAMLNLPLGLHWDRERGDLLIADSANDRIRKVVLGDRVPLPFSFPATQNVPRATQVRSDPVTPTGYDTATSVSVAGGEYSAGCTTTFTPSAGTISPGQSVCVRHLSAAGRGQMVTTTLTVGGVGATFTSTTETGQPNSVALAASPSRSVAGQTVVFTTTVTASAGTPTGSIAFRAGSVVLCPGVPLASGAAQCATAALSAGEHGVVAEYSGDEVFAGGAAELRYIVRAPGTFVITVSKTGDGAGTVTSTPAAIDCGMQCSASYTQVVDVTLSATPAAGSAFLGWSAGCSGFGSCLLATDATMTIEAMFAQAADRLAVNPRSLAFGAHVPGIDSPAQTLTVKNVGTVPLTVSGVTISNAQFVQTHDCGTLAPGATCEIRVTFRPAPPEPGSGNSAEVSATLTVASNGAIAANPVSLSGTSYLSLVEHFYRSILRRAPDTPGKAFWEGEAERMRGLGANINEVWFVMAGYFFNSPEYRSYNRVDVEFVTDLYTTFFNRAPDAQGLGYWTGQIAAGLPREIVLFSFMFSNEFRTFTQGIFGNTAARPEVDMVVDFFRGLLNRLPDTTAFNYWLGRLRTAQCAGAGPVYTEVDAISAAFMFNPEYDNRVRSNTQFVTDMYYSFLRRGGDVTGVQFWINELNSGQRFRNDVRYLGFLNSPEFGARVQAVIAGGCAQ